MFKIPLDKTSPLKNILTPKTTVFCYFVNLKQPAADSQACLLPEISVKTALGPITFSYLEILAKKAQFCKEKGMPFKLAIDRTGMNLAQRENIKTITKKLKIDLVDLADLEHHESYDSLQKRYADRAKAPNAEFVDRCKLLLLNLAGKQGYNDILVIDFDMELDKLLFVREDSPIAFTYSPRHYNCSTDAATENSMIYFSKNRATIKTADPEDRGQAIKEVDLIEDVFDALKQGLENPSENDENPKPIYSYYLFFKTAHDSIFRLDQGFELSPFERSPAVHNYAKNLLLSIIGRGRYLIHGDYFSINHQSWFKDKFSRITCEQSIAQLNSILEKQEQQQLPINDDGAQPLVFALDSQKKQQEPRDDQAYSDSDAPRAASEAPAKTSP